VSAAFTWQGLTEAESELEALPRDLVAEGQTAAEELAATAVDELKAVYAYHHVTGNLARGLQVRKVSDGTYAKGSEVRNRAQHSWLFDNGSAVRETKRGAGRGASRPHHAFDSVMHQKDQIFETMIAQLLREHGLGVEVS